MSKSVIVSVDIEIDQNVYQPEFAVAEVKAQVSRLCMGKVIFDCVTDLDDIP